jgi:hypothetical protein
MSRYIFEHNKEERELRRLRMIEAAVDPETTALLTATGMKEGWTCLELGAGAGSIVDWMGTRVGLEGRVIAVDKKAGYLARFSSPPYQIVEGNFLEVSCDRPVDLLHERYVLIHNREDAAIMKKIRSVVKPGGYVVLEEPDFTSARWLNPFVDPSCQRVNEAICRMFENAGLDPGYGLGLPGKLAAFGLEIQRTNSLIHLCPGQSPIAQVMAESALVLRQEYVETAVATDEDIDQYVASARDPRLWAVYYSTVSVVARVW